MYQQVTKAAAMLSLIVVASMSGCRDSATMTGLPNIPDGLVASIRDDLAAATLTTPADVEYALSNAIHSDRAVVFVHMDWAMMAPQRDRFTRFAVEFHRRFPHESVGFHYVDCTPITKDYTPLKSLPGWPGSGREIYALQGTGGGGGVIWIDHGVVQHVEMVLESEDTAELIKKTRHFLAAAHKDR